jgi:hypothetical protein
MPADRFRARLASLDHETLLSYAAELSVAHRHEADALLVKHSPLPVWAHDDVLLSVDLLPHVFATLQLDDNSAASVCQAWKAAWVATNYGRRGLRPIALPDPDLLLSGDMNLAVELPDGNLLVQKYGSYHHITRILNPTMQTIASISSLFAGSYPFNSAVASDLGLFVVCETPRYAVLRRYNLDTFKMTHEYESAQYEQMFYITLAPGELLFALGRDIIGAEENEEMVCFDARTLEVRHRFGRGTFSNPGVYGMVAVGNELFVLDTDTYKNLTTIKVFSLAGLLLRSIDIGNCVYPFQLYHFDERLYLMNQVIGDDSERMIIALTLEGERLQVWRPDAGCMLMSILCIYDRMLLVRTGTSRIEVLQGKSRIEALQGI